MSRALSSSPRVAPSDTLQQVEDGGLAQARWTRRADGVWSTLTSDGLDYYRVCERHQWASGDFQVLPVPPCPLCEADAARHIGRQRYVALHVAGVALREA